jgi:hypothetical protein
VTNPNARRVSAAMVQLLGREHQLEKAIEEAKEFVAAVREFILLAQTQVVFPRESSAASVIDEAADLELMLDQVRVMFGDEAIDQARAAKLKRTVGRFNLEDE